MLTIPADVLTAAGVSLLSAAGLPAKQAVVATDHLVESNLVGHDSHGVIRIPYYVKGLRSGELAPVGNQKVVRETPSTLVLDANHSFGIVLAYDAMREAVKRPDLLLRRCSSPPLRPYRRLGAILSSPQSRTASA